MPRILFSKANAAEMGRRGQIATRRSRIERLLRSVTPADIPHKAPVDYVNSMLVRARMILDGIYARAERLRSLEAHELASRSAERWTKIEFALAGRPMPGSRRPGRDPRGEGMREAVTLDVPSQPVPASRQVVDVPSQLAEPPTGAPLEPNPPIAPNSTDVSH